MPPSSKKRTRSRGWGEEGDTSNAAVAEQGYGVSPVFMGQAAGSSARYTVKPISIFELHPDLTQPRHIMPTEIRNQWDFDPRTVPRLLEAWITLVSRERGVVFNPQDYLHLEEGDFEAFEAAGPLDKDFLDLLKLAVTILDKEGLTNAITAMPTAAGWYIETGERRWLAYHLLHLATGDEKWSRIPVQEVPRISVWDQATENNSREPLNAIAKARELAKLVMDVRREIDAYRTYEECLGETGSDRTFFAQVADGSVHIIPRGQAPRLVAAMNFRSPKQLREYRALLRLPDEVWNLADDYNLTEFALRQLIDDSLSDEQKVALTWAIIRGEIDVADGEASDEGSEKDSGSGSQPGSPSRKGQPRDKVAGFCRTVQRLEKRFAKFDVTAVEKEQRRQVVDSLERLLARWKEGL